MTERPLNADTGGAHSASDTLDALDRELEASLLRELSARWGDYNHSYFHGALRRPALALTNTRDLLGRWDPERRLITLSRPFVLAASWGSVLEVLKHEMAHQYVHEVAGITDETAHGPAFRRVCERIGIDAAATGVPAASDDDEQRLRLLKRVSALLALAESQNRHEAENAAALAQKLMLRHNIELVNRAERRRYGFRHLGEPKSRRQEAEHILAGILAEHFFVEAIWVSGYRARDGKRGSLLEICGTPENLEIASYVYGFLQQTADRLWLEHKDKHGIRKDRDRRTFVAGVMEGFAERLGREKGRAREKGLVWVGDADLDRFYRARHPHVRSVRVQGHGFSAARAHGRSAGRDIVLHKGVRGAASGGPRRLLPGKR